MPRYDKDTGLYLPDLTRDERATLRSRAFDLVGRVMEGKATDKERDELARIDATLYDGGRVPGGDRRTKGHAAALSGALLAELQKRARVTPDAEIRARALTTREAVARGIGRLGKFEEPGGSG